MVLITRTTAVVPTTTKTLNRLSTKEKRSSKEVSSKSTTRYFRSHFFQRLGALFSLSMLHKDIGSARPTYMK